MALAQDIPFLPQLPKADPLELMIPQALDGFPGVINDSEGLSSIDVDAWRAKSTAFSATLDQALNSGNLEPFEPTAASCRCLRPFLWEIESRKAPFAKVQLAGLMTVRWVTRTTAGAPVATVPELDSQIFRHLFAKALALVKAVRRAGATPMLVLDEPGLYSFSVENPTHRLMLKELEMVAVSAQREGALVGLHCCSNTRWNELLSLSLDVLFIDARLSLESVLQHREAFGAFIARGSTLGLGIIPTDLKVPYVVETLVESAEKAVRAAAPQGMSSKTLLHQMILTPACGLGMRSVKDAERIVEDVRVAQRMLRSL
jgi:hypothetical protein